MLNVGTRHVLKVLAKRLKKFLGFAFSPNQIGYIKDFESKEERLILDVLNVIDSLKLISLLVTLDTQKPFHSIKFILLISSLGTHVFGKGFINWSDILLKK